MSRSTVWATAVAVVGLIAWFFFAWLGLKRNAVDAAGESVGSALVLLLLVSIGGALVRKRGDSKAQDIGRGR